MTDSIRPRIYKYDNVKLFAITLVVITGFAEEFTSHSDIFRSWFVFCYSFHAPLFVFLSGLFQKQYSEKVRLNIRRISFFLLLGFLLKLLIFLVNFLNGDGARLDLLGGSGIEWFLFVAAGYTLLMYLLKGVNRYVMLAIAVAVGVGAGWLPLGDRLYAMRFLVFLPFYVAGYYLTPKKVRRFTHRLNVKMAGIAFIFIYFVLCFRQKETMYPLREIFTGQHPYSNLPVAGYPFILRLLCYGISAVLIISVLACVPNRKFPVLTGLGRNTVGVYFWHYPIILLLWHFGVMDMFIPLGDPQWKYLMILAATALSLVLSLSIFSLPLRKLGELVQKTPEKACIAADLIIIATDVVIQLTLL